MADRPRMTEALLVEHSGVGSVLNQGYAEYDKDMIKYGL